jgi:hypothetical protein
MNATRLTTAFDHLCELGTRQTAAELSRGGPRYQSNHRRASAGIRPD